MDLKTTPVFKDGQEKVNVQYHLHLKDADVQANLDTIEDTSMLPEEFQQGFLPMFGDANTNFKMAATEMMDNAFEQRTSDVITNYFSNMKSEYVIPRKPGHENFKEIILNTQAMPLEINQKGAVSIDYNTHSDMLSTNRQGVMELLHPTQKSAGVIDGENQLEITKGQLNDNKHHMLIAPHLISGVLSTFDNNQVSFKLEDQKDLQKKVNEYFGNDIEIECYKHEHEMPQYHTENDAIIGEQKIVCSLHPKGLKSDSLYEIDVNLDFAIHPELDEDGESLKASFGEIQATEISVHEGKMEISTSLSDKMDDMAMAMQFDPFMNELMFPFSIEELMSMEDASVKTQQRDAATLLKFKDLLNTPYLIQTSQLEENLLPKAFRLPLPKGLKFSANSSIKMHSNGVMDISGDMESTN